MSPLKSVDGKNVSPLRVLYVKCIKIYDSWSLW